MHEAEAPSGRVVSSSSDSRQTAGHAETDRRSRLVLALLMTGVSLWTGCGSSQPTAPSPSPSQIAGTWHGEQRLTTLSGAECLAPDFDDLLKLPSQFHATLTQSGASVTAELDIDHTGSVCTFTGSLDGNTLVLSQIGCRGTRTLALSCANGAMRDLLPASETIHATIDGGTIAGIAAENDNVLVSGTGDRVAVLVAESSFTLTRQ
jgi:hypothetical protein